jgi:alkylation response protein AidB-like acyl-CoA dehydrogenase
MLLLLKKVGLVLLDQKKENGIRGSDTLFNVYRCKGSKENRIGEDGFGFAFAMNVLNGGRIGLHLKH